MVMKTFCFCLSFALLSPFLVSGQGRLLKGEEKGGTRTDRCEVRDSYSYIPIGQNENAEECETLNHDARIDATYPDEGMCIRELLSVSMC